MESMTVKEKQKIRKIIQKESGWHVVKLFRLKFVNPRRVSFWGKVYTFDKECNLLAVEELKEKKELAGA
jgi:hypothetical protein